MADPRLMIEEPLSAGAALVLDEAQARHVGTVLRLEVGGALRVFNAADGEWRARVVEKSKRGMKVAVEALLRQARAPADLELLFAPVKRHATDLIVEKATELGVARMRPVITQRTIAETVRIDRLANIAREAAEQTERFDVPEILEPQTLPRALDGWDASRPLIYADESGDEDGRVWGGEQGRAAPIADVLASWTAGVPAGDGASTRADATSFQSNAGEDAGAPSKLAILIGPEGGFTIEERRMLRALPYVRAVSLGPRILRAETAAIATLAVVQAYWGDWGRR